MTKNLLENYPAHEHGNETALANRFDNYALDNPVSVSKKEFNTNIFRTEKYTMLDGSEYLVTHSELGRRAIRGTDKVMSLETSAWFTKFGGFNQRRQRALAEHFGMPSVFVGVPQNLDRIGNLKSHARNMLAIHAHLAMRTDNDPDNLILNGVSRGAMTADIAQSIAHEHDSHVIYNDAIVPCMPNGVTLLKFLSGFRETIPNELGAVRSLRLPLSILLHYRDTFDASPRGLFQQLKETPTLMSGQVGRSVRANDDIESFFGYQTVYEGDMLSQGEKFEKLYDNHPYTKVELIPKGGHISCVSSDAYYSWKDRMRTISDILHENPAAASLSAAAMYSIACEKNPVFEV